MFQNKTISDQIYESLRKDIIELTIKPGEKLSEVKLSHKFNVSRAPVRDAIKKLQQAELVSVLPQVGTIVMPISLQKAKDLLQIRLLLESYAAEVASQNITDEDLLLLEKKFRDLENCEDDFGQRRKELFETDMLLHRTIWRRCGNREIENIISNYMGEIHRIRLATLVLADRLVPTTKEMMEIFNALKKKNPVHAREAMKEHILNIQKSIESVIKEKKISQE